MAGAWHGFLRMFSWSLERGSWRYDLAVGAILLFVFLTPRDWFRDHPQTAPLPHAVAVTLLYTDAGSGARTYRVDSHLLARPRLTPELEREIHDVLNRNVAELQGQRFRIERVQTVLGEDGTVLFYDVSVK